MEKMRTFHELNNMHIGKITDRIRNVYEMYINSLLMERDFTPEYVKNNADNINTLASLEVLFESNPFKRFYGMLQEAMLLDHHLQHRYRYCPDCLMKHQGTIEAFYFSLPRDFVHRNVADFVISNLRANPNNMVSSIDVMMGSLFRVNAQNRTQLLHQVLMMSLAREAAMLPGNAEELGLTNESKFSALYTPHEMRIPRKRQGNYVRRITEERFKNGEVIEH